MSYSVVVCDDIADLKTQHPGATVPVAATIFGHDYPTDEDYSVYVWNDDSLATPDDNEVVKPTQDPTTNGRWLKVNIDSSVAPQVNSDWNASSGVSQILNKPTLFSGSYLDLSNKPSIPSAQVNTDWNSSSGISQLLNKPSLATVATSGNYADLTNKPASASQSATSRSLNTAFQISVSRNAFVSYSVQLTVTASIAGGQNGDVVLEIASNSSFTNDVQTIAIAGVGQTYTLAVAIQGVQPQTGCVSGFVPAGYYTRLRSVNNTGTPSYSIRAGQEILI